jgi:hypothetical protein
MGLKIFLSFIFILFVVVLLVFYWFIPFGTIEFNVASDNYNFSLNTSDMENMQFYKNMRYPDSKISYKIYDCPLQKKNDMLEAFEIVSNNTILKFYPFDTGNEEFSGEENFSEREISTEEISVTCDSEVKIEEGMFIAGEGGPTEVIGGEIFNIILHGKILLIKESTCERPNIAIHELLHVLGFNHSDNPNNIMYPFSKCRQTIGEDIPILLNQLYSVPSYSDLAFENVSAVMHGRYLDANVTVRNDGLRDSEKTKLEIYADENFVKEIDLDIIEMGYKKRIKLSNVWIKKTNFQELKFFINSSFNELEKKNNKIVLEIKE